MESNYDALAGGGPAAFGSLGRGFGRMGGSFAALGGASIPAPPDGFVYLLGADGAYLLGADGAYLLGVAP